MRRKIGILCMAAGVVLVAAAMSLSAYNWADDTRAGETSQRVLAELKVDVEEQASQLASEEISSEIYQADYFSQEETVTQDAVMDTVSVEENRYVGYLTIPSLGLELPVMNEWSYDLLQIAPCRYAGSVWSEDLVIAGHNYTHHFGRLSNLVPGEELYFTDANGYVFTYQVSLIETVEATDVESMISGEYDLSLFTCTYDGVSRVCVRCTRTGTLASIAS